MFNNNIVELYGSKVFNDSTMRQKLPAGVYRELKKTIKNGKSLELPIAQVVATAMKDWALEKGATHYTHWFQPMTGITAEKHDAFISPNNDGTSILEFSGKELIKGESDASSFPSGGIRATFEARGYTAWDPTSYAFIKDNTLYIPTAFCSYSGEALDKKTPLLRSMSAVSDNAMRLLRLFGNNTAKRVDVTVGAEQEYFLIDKKLYNMRKDLIFCGRTLFGALPPKRQELEDHYYGNIKQRVSDYMKELDFTLWELGVAAKTKHNEAAPAQHELACMYTTVNIACDHNQIVMEMMKKIALKHGLVCLLQEKPFAGVNGSGKHNNWSLSTDEGENLFDPGDSPMENAQFLTFLCAVIKAADEYADLLRLSVATAGNDHRLGANEAPPAIISIHLGDELTSILEAFEKGESHETQDKIAFDLGVSSLPKFPKDTTDRNRTSPFAFTGNKFEFRMVGSALSVSGVNIVINAIVADVLHEFANRLEKTDEDFNTALQELLKETLTKHKRVIYNGNNYAELWVEEAKKRGLLNLKSSVDAIPHFSDSKNVEMFVKHKIFTPIEVKSRQDILMETYSKVINIEALTMIDMVKKDILPASLEYTNFIINVISGKKSLNLICVHDESLAKLLNTLTENLITQNELLEQKLADVKMINGINETAQYYHDEILTVMEKLRSIADELEMNVGSKYWPIPVYSDLLFRD